MIVMCWTRGTWPIDNFVDGLCLSPHWDIDNLVNELYLRDLHSFLHLLNHRHLALHLASHCNGLFQDLTLGIGMRSNLTVQDVCVQMTNTM